jgi:hypothetical protein
LPELLGRRLVFYEKMGQRHRSIEIDQRSPRSWANWPLSSRVRGLRVGPRQLLDLAITTGIKDIV